jgi:hypothetical protein
MDHASRGQRRTLSHLRGPGSSRLSALGRHRIDPARPKAFAAPNMRAGNTAAAWAGAPPQRTSPRRPSGWPSWPTSAIRKQTTTHGSARVSIGRRRARGSGRMWPALRTNGNECVFLIERRRSMKRWPSHHRMRKYPNPGTDPLLTLRPACPGFLLYAEAREPEMTVSALWRSCLGFGLVRWGSIDPQPISDRQTTIISAGLESTPDRDGNPERH